MEQAAERLRTALVDRYRVERELGSGGMATVYLAEDLKHHRQVALKVLRPELAAVLGADRFLREIEIAAKLTHPHILPLFDSGEADGVLYYVMPYVAGESLRDRLNREKQLGIEDALRIAREVADALDHAHRQGVVHRDIKPENVLLEERHAVVADFGIARAITVAGGEKLTATGVAVGTPEYMSPEQASGRGELDGRSDIYALGCVLHEMLAGFPPFTAPTVDAVLRQHLTAPPPAVTAIRPAVPGPASSAIQRALAKTPADRFSTAAQFADALAPPEPSAVPGAGPPPDAGRSRRVGRLALVGGASVVVIVGGLLVLRLRRGASAPAGPAFERTAIAVLPFENLSAEEPHGYFAGGLYDEILTQLSKVAALKVISRTSVMGYAGPTTPPLKQIASQLEVGSIVEGSVQVVGGRLRVNVQLIDAATDAHLWAERYDRTLDDAFAIQSEVGQRIVEAVGGALTGAEQQSIAAAPTANPEAYRLYLQGREYFNRPGYLRQNWEIAQRLFEQALALDPSYALAHAALAQVHGSMSWFRYDPSPERLARQREEAEIAVRLAPELPQAHIAMGRMHYDGQGDWAAALREYRMALGSLPNDAGVWNGIAVANRRLGNWTDVFEAFEKVRALSPRSANAFHDLGGNFSRFLRRYADAIEAYERALTLAPDLSVARIGIGVTYILWKGELDTLRAALKSMPADEPLGDMGTANAQRARLLLWEQNSDGLLALLGTAGAAPFDAQDFFLPTALYAAWAHQLRGDDSMAGAAFDAARRTLDSVIVKLREDWRVHAARGLALAGLRRSQEALREARWLQQSQVYQRDAYGGTRAAEDRARILAQVGELDAALDEIQRLLAGPAYYLSVHTLRLDPLWNPIRDHPRFKALLAKYAEQ